MKIQHDKYSDKYYLHLSDSNVVALSFEEVEDLSEKFQQVCTEEYSKALQMELDIGGEDCEGGACKI